MPSASISCLRQSSMPLRGGAVRRRLRHHLPRARHPPRRAGRGSASASGRLCQYFFGISARIASRFARAGLKVARSRCATSLPARRSSARLLARTPPDVGQFLAVPMQRALRREDRPAHRGEAADEEVGASRRKMRCSGSNQAMKCSPSSASTRRKRTKAVILCMSRRTDFSMRCSRCTSGSEAIEQQLALAVRDAPEQLVEQREALGIAVADRRSRQAAR